MTRARVLVVDDEPAMLHSVQRILGSEYDVRGEATALAALATAREFEPQLAIVDIRMPDLDGFALMTQLKQHDPDLQVVLMTGSVYEVDEQLIRAIREKAFYYIQKPFDRGVLLALVQRAFELDALTQANRRHMAHLRSQLDEARAFQQTLLPPPVGRVGLLQVMARYAPCDELAGDFYDYAPARSSGLVPSISSPAGSSPSVASAVASAVASVEAPTASRVAPAPDDLALIVADVVGHGASAAMMTALVKSAFHASAADGWQPLAVAKRVKQAVAGLPPDRFVTLLAARISPSRGILEYVNAGHEGGAVYHRGDLVRELAATGPIVSPAFPDRGWELVTVPWQHESFALLYTDGVPESYRDGEQYGSTRIHQLVAAHASQPQRVIPALLAEVEAFAHRDHPEDDRTLMGVWEG